jgi:hypothetical protein
MKVRSDISDKVVHFTSGNSLEDAFGNLCQIIEGRRINGNSNKIRGGYQCVCFTEAPLTSVEGGLVNPKAYSRYSPFGVIFEKSWIFGLGGRPAIYQPESEFTLLDESLKWRHVRYEPCATPPIDLTWEREWRIQTSALEFSPEIAGLVVPSRQWAQRLRDSHAEQEDWRVLEYSMIMDAMLAELYREEFSWQIFTLT